jgi:hypothetical protein
MKVFQMVALETEAPFSHSRGESFIFSYERMAKSHLTDVEVHCYSIRLDTMYQTKKKKTQKKKEKKKQEVNHHHCHHRHNLE